MVVAVVNLKMCFLASECDTCVGLAGGFIFCRRCGIGLVRLQVCSAHGSECLTFGVCSRALLLVLHHGPRGFRISWGVDGDVGQLSWQPRCPTLL